MTYTVKELYRMKLSLGLIKTIWLCKTQEGKFKADPNEFLPNPMEDDEISELFIECMYVFGTDVKYKNGHPFQDYFDYKPLNETEYNEFMSLYFEEIENLNANDYEFALYLNKT